MNFKMWDNSFSSANEYPIPKVSIGMPVFNGQRFICKALDSLLAQSLTDCELIISDNASTDATGEICRGYASKDGRIRYIRQSENRGATWNFKHVLEKARAKYFMWAACDDEWSSNYVQRLTEALDRDLTVDFVYSRYVMIDECSHLLIPGQITFWVNESSFLAPLFRPDWYLPKWYNT